MKSIAEVCAWFDTWFDTWEPAGLVVAFLILVWVSGCWVWRTK